MRRVFVILNSPIEYYVNKIFYYFKKSIAFSLVAGFSLIALSGCSNQTDGESQAIDACLQIRSIKLLPKSVTSNERIAILSNAAILSLEASSKNDKYHELYLNMKNLMDSINAKDEDSAGTSIIGVVNECELIIPE